MNLTTSVARESSVTVSDTTRKIIQNDIIMKRIKELMKDIENIPRVLDGMKSNLLDRLVEKIPTNWKSLFNKFL